MGLEARAIALTTLAFVNLGCQAIDKIPNPGNFTETPNPRPPTIAQVDTRLIPPPLPTNTGIPTPYITVIATGTSTKVVEAQSTATPSVISTQQEIKVMTGMGTSSMEITKREVLDENGCKIIFGPDSVCYAIGFPDKKIDYVKEQFEKNRFPPEFYSARPDLTILEFGVYKDLAEMNPLTERIEIKARPGDEGKISITQRMVDFVMAIRTNKLYKDVPLGVLLPVPSNSNDPVFNATLYDRQSLFSRELVAALADDRHTFFVDPKDMPIEYRDKERLSHLVKKSYEEIVVKFKAEAEKLLKRLSGTPTPAPFVPTPVGAR